MALVTRCPKCATAFRVTAQHLQMHGGDVRCGHCAHVFNGFATLTTVQEPEADGVSKALDARTTSEGAAGFRSTEGLPAEAAGIASTMLERYPYDIEQPRKNQQIWGFASLFLLFLLAGQAVYFYRTEISILVPDTRPYLEQYCELLGCTISLQQQAGLLSIESSDLQADFTQSNGAAVLTATVRNYAPYPQAYPVLELTLTDIQDQPLASRIFTPGEYLGRDANPTKTIAPAHEIDIKLHLASDDLNAAGYRLFLLYP